MPDYKEKIKKIKRLERGNKFYLMRKRKALNSKIV